jgi:hypothetical protein
LDRITDPEASAAKGAVVPSTIVAVKAESTPFTFRVAV